MKIPVSDILVDHSQNVSREDYNSEAIQDLASDIVTNGQIQPVVVRPIEHPDYKYQLMVGYCRMMACTQILGQTEIKADIDEEADEESARLKNIAENLKRNSLSFWDTCQMMKRTFPPDWSSAKVAKALGMDRGWARNRWYVFRLPDEVIDQVKAGLLSASDVNILLAKTPEEQIASCRLLVEGKAQGRTNREMAEEISNRKAVRSLQVVRHMMTKLLEVDRMDEVNCLRWAVGEISETMLWELLDNDSGS